MSEHLRLAEPISPAEFVGIDMIVASAPRRIENTTCLPSKLTSDAYVHSAPRAKCHTSPASSNCFRHPDVSYERVLISPVWCIVAL